MGCFGVVVCSVNAAYCALVHAQNLWRKESGAVSAVVTSRSNDIIVFQPVQDGREFFRQFVRLSIKSAAQIVNWYTRERNYSGMTVVQHWSVAKDSSRKAGASYFSSGGIDIHEVLHVEMLVEQSSSLPSQS